MMTKRPRILGLTAVCFTLVLLAYASIQPASARPDFLERFRMDPMRRPDVDGCATCHLNPQGGGARNDFGLAFQAAGLSITPMLRANFPDRFKVETVKLPSGAVFYFSDPEGKSVVYEQNQVKTLVDLASLVPRPVADKIPPASNRMSFFITSKSIGTGGNLGGLAGADGYCQSLAKAVGAGDRMWRAYLSTSFDGSATVNAGDRIGSGPWYNARGVLIARGPADLEVGARLNPETVLNEKGEKVDLDRTSSGHSDVPTGTQPDGTAAIDMNCNNWTNSGEGKAIAGHFAGNGKWNSAHPTGCSEASFSGAGALLYCFATGSSPEK